MCIVDNCFTTPATTASPSTKVSHHTNKALCAFAWAIIAATALISTAYTVFTPLLPSEYLVLTLYSVATVVALAKTAMEVARAWNARN